MHRSTSVSSATSGTPIFVVGAPRSGTTLTGQILGRHPEICSLGETHYFEDVWTRRNTLGELKSEEQLEAALDRVRTLFGRFNFPEAQSLVDGVVDRRRLIELTRSLGGGYGALYDSFTRTLAQSIDKSRFCDDTPKHLYYLPTIFELLPGAKAIVCVRDPRDFMASYKNYWRRSSDSDRIRALYHPLITSLLWRSAANLALSYIQRYGSERLMIVRYEQLVDRPEVEIRHLCRFLGLAYSDTMMRVESHNSSFGEKPQGIYASSVGRWRSELEMEEVWWSQTIGRGKLRAMGYEREPASPSFAALLLTFVQAPVALIRALRANSRKRGPLLPYLWRRVKTLAIPQ